MTNMAEAFLASQTKSKYRWKREGFHSYLFVIVTLIYLLKAVESVSDCSGVECYHGSCVQNGTVCQCFDGWGGQSCDHCFGRVRLTDSVGVITDGRGNYSEDNKCIWLIETDPPGQPIRLRAHQFATECGWDHLYVFDGDSVFSPLLAAYSGLVQTQKDLNNTLSEVVAQSGKAFLYFYSDAAYNMTGFNLHYSVGTCPLDCSGHGQCNGTACLCDAGWMGEACSEEMCPNSCSQSGPCINGVCQCSPLHKGKDCSLSLKDESWESFLTQNSPSGRASAASVVIGNELWVAGGFSFGAQDDFLVRYSFDTKSWATVTPVSTENPEALHGHSLAVYKGNLYVFGGVSGSHVESRLWIYNVSGNTWSFQDYNDTEAVAGHTAVVVGDTMFLIMGHSPVYGYLNTVKEMNLASGNNITSPAMKGALVKGGYGHSSVYSVRRGEIYVHGGYHSASTSKYYLSDSLYSYNPTQRLWTILARSGSPRYLHSGVILGELMLVFGGNTHNDTSFSLGAMCYSTEFLAYDIDCNSWRVLSTTDIPADVDRYGHTAQAYTDSYGNNYMYVFGGFDGLMFNDLLKYSVGHCSLYTNETACLAAFPGQECVWADTQCLSRADVARRQALGETVSYTQARNCTKSAGSERICKQFKSCGSCLSTVYDCMWCNNNCSAKCPENSQYSYSDVAKCPHKYNAICDRVDNCHMCATYKDCTWDSKTCRFRDEYAHFDQSGGADTRTTCNTSCYKQTSCQNCTRQSCMWCGSLQRCVETNSYVASFLYGQCQEWTTQYQKCPVTECSSLHTCDECKMNPSCGWCNDASNTGLGSCVKGSAAGPVTLKENSTEYEVNPAMCPSERWHFITCPSCQCNGHSSCTNVTDKCDKCQNLTTGDHCEQCVDGYWGNPKNGGGCKACSCNNQADKCDSADGTCFCRTRGVKGAKCNECDTQNNYLGDPNNGGTCYYDLKTDYQFTFNLSKTEDKYFTGINFMNRPQASDRDVDFTVNCSAADEGAYLNITYKSNSHPHEIYRVKQFSCKYFRSKFEHKDFNFGPDNNVTFFVYIYNFKTPFWLQISFSQFPKIDLVHFFVTFFSCFLSLLLIAAILYKVKHKFDSYRRRQRMNMELEEMASRPFACTVIEVDKKFDVVAEKKDNSTDLRKRKRVSTKPGQMALEPLNNQKAAVISLFVQLPTGGDEFAPPGNSGMAIASALVTLGNQRKQSLEHIKSDKIRHKKHPFPAQLDTCV